MELCRKEQEVLSFNKVHILLQQWIMGQVRYLLCIIFNKFSHVLSWSQVHVCDFANMLPLHDQPDCFDFKCMYAPLLEKSQGKSTLLFMLYNVIKICLLKSVICFHQLCFSCFRQRMRQQNGMISCLFHTLASARHNDVRRGLPFGRHISQSYERR